MILPNRDLINSFIGYCLDSSISLRNTFRGFNPKIIGVL